VSKAAKILVLVMLIVSSFFAFDAHAMGNYGLLWSRSFGGENSDSFYSVASAPDGGYVAVGASYSSDGDLDELNTDQGSAIIVKYTRDGVIEWSRNFGGSGYDDSFYAAAAAADGGFIVVGASSSSDGDLAGLNKGRSDAIIAKYSASGALEWNRNFGGRSHEIFYSVAPTSDGGYIAAGYSSSTDGDLVGKNKGNGDAVVVKYDANGTLEWNKNFGGNRDDVFYSIATIADGGYIAAGTSFSTNGDLVGVNQGWGDAVIVKLSSDGAVEWSNNFGGSMDDYFRSVVSTPDGGYAVVGYSESIDGDLTGLDRGDCDAIIVKYRSDGALEWKRSFGGDGYDRFESVALMSDGGYVAAGYSDSENGDLTGLNKGYTDAVIVKFSPDGTLEWNRNFGGGNADSFSSITMGSDGGYVAAGWSDSSDGDLTELNRGYEDAIIVKYLDVTTDAHRPDAPIIAPPNTGIYGARVDALAIIGVVLSLASLMLYCLYGNFFKCDCGRY